MRRLFLILLILLYNPLFSQSIDNVEQGRVRIKLKPLSNARMLQYVPAIKTQGLSADPVTKELTVGLQSLDVLNSTYKAVSMKRVFPHAGKHERKQEKFGLHLWYDIEIKDGANPVDIAEIYMSDLNVDIAEPVLKIKYEGELDTIVSKAFTPADPGYERQWHYNNTGQTGGTPGVDIKLADAWTVSKGKLDVIVAVVDGGIDFTHEDLKDNMWVNEAEANGEPGVDDDGNGFIDDIYGFNFVDTYGYTSASPTGPAPIIAGRHGTHVAGTVAARTDNDKGGAGVAGGDRNTRGIRLMSVQTLVDNSDKGAYIGAAIAYAANNGAVILQNSWGFLDENYESASVYEALKYFIQYAGTDEDGNPLLGTPMVGGIAIFASGNENSSGNWYPARYDEVMAVSSVNHYGKRAYYSNFGEWVDISGPGGDTQEKTTGGVYSTLPGNEYGYMQGTSMACPHVSGVAALILSKFGSETYTPDMLWGRLISSVNALPDESLYTEYNMMGSGLTDAYKALANNVPVTGVTLPANITIHVSETSTINSTIIPASATDHTATWKVADASIVSITTGFSDGNAFAVLTGKLAGTTTVTATTNDGGYTATTTVKVLSVPVEGINIRPDKTSMDIGTTFSPTVEILPSGASDKTVRWSSTNTAVATVAGGVITAHSVGVSNITAVTEDGGFSATCEVTVTQPVERIEINPEKAKLMINDTVTLYYTIYPSDASDKTVRWKSSNENVAIVSTAGKVQAKKAGEAQISVETGNGKFTADCDLTVSDEIQAPEGFSPNNDGINDNFVLILDSQDTYTLRVFDRSGQIYYESTDYGNDWDGIANTGFNKGSKVLPGTYFYSLTSNGNGSSKKGYVVIRY